MHQSDAVTSSRLLMNMHLVAGRRNVPFDAEILDCWIECMCLQPEIRRFISYKFGKLQPGVRSDGVFQQPASSSGVACRIVAVVITYERPALLRRCLEALHAQR